MINGYRQKQFYLARWRLKDSHFSSSLKEDQSKNFHKKILYIIYNILLLLFI